MHQGVGIRIATHHLVQYRDIRGRNLRSKFDKIAFQIVHALTQAALCRESLCLKEHLRRKIDTGCLLRTLFEQGLMQVPYAAADIEYARPSYPRLSQACEELPLRGLEAVTRVAPVKTLGKHRE